MGLTWEILFAASLSWLYPRTSFLRLEFSVFITNSAVCYNCGIWYKCGDSQLEVSVFIPSGTLRISTVELEINMVNSGPCSRNLILQMACASSVAVSPRLPRRFDSTVPANSIQSSSEVETLHDWYTLILNHFLIFAQNNHDCANSWSNLPQYISLLVTVWVGTQLSRHIWVGFPLQGDRESTGRVC